MKKLCSILVIWVLLCPILSHAQELYDSPWLLVKQTLGEGENEVILFEKDSENNPFDLSKISLKFSPNGTYTGTNVWGEPVDGIFSITQNKITVDGEEADFLMVDSTSFRISNTKPLLGADTSLHNVLTTSVYQKALTTNSHNNQSQIESIDQIRLYPTPVNDLLHVEFTLKKSLTVEIKLYDIKGSILKSVARSLPQGEHKESLDLSNFATGTYVLSLRSEEYKFSQKIIKN